MAVELYRNPNFNPSVTDGFAHSGLILNNYYYLVGSYYYVNGVRVNRIAKLDKNGILDSTFLTNAGTGTTGGFDNYTWQIKKIDIGGEERLLIGGNFTKYNNVDYYKLIVLNQDGTVYSGFTSPFDASTTGGVFQFNQWDNSINTWGIFGDFDAGTYNAGVVISGDTGAKSFDFSNVGFSGGTGAIIHDGILDYNAATGYAYLGGAFTWHDGSSPRYNLMKINWSSLPPSIVTTFNASSNNFLGSTGVLRIQMHPADAVLVCGYFALLGYGNRCLAQISRSSGLPYSAYMNSIGTAGNSEAWCMAQTGNIIDNDMIFGSFNAWDGTSVYHNVQIETSGDYLTTFPALSGHSSIRGGSIPVNWGNDDVEALLVGQYKVGLYQFNEYPSDIPVAPSGLTVTGITYTDATLNWVNDSDVGINVIQRWTGSNWVNVDTIALSASTYTLTGLTPYTEYTYRVALLYESIYYPSNSVTFITLMPLPSFCETALYTISGSTCGNSDGKITIVDTDYFLFYDFTLTDIDGNSYTFNTTTGEATGLTSNYYFLTATVKPAYWYHYGRETCTFEWIEVIDTDTTMSNTSKSVRNVVCGGFGRTQGRIAYLCTDSGSNPIYTAKLYNKDTYDLVQTVTGTTIDLIIFSPLNAGDYYCHITNDAGCSLLIGATKVQGQSLRSVAGIKKLWLTQWDENVEYDYWAQSDDDYYLSGIDADFFNSIKIKRFIDSTLPDVWYSVNVQTKAITFSQTMEKTKQGFVFNDKLALTIPEADNTKWKELVDILQNRYILIFLDNNGYYWCMGYRHGASTDGYKRENNEYILEFNAISENKILTNIDKQYIIDSIL